MDTMYQEMFWSILTMALADKNSFKTNWFNNEIRRLVNLDYAVRGTLND